MRILGHTAPFLRKEDNIPPTVGLSGSRELVQSMLLALASAMAPLTSTVEGTGEEHWAPEPACLGWDPDCAITQLGDFGQVT